MDRMGIGVQLHPLPPPTKKMEQEKNLRSWGSLNRFQPRVSFRFCISKLFFGSGWFRLVQVDALAFSKIIPYTSEHLLIRDWLGIPRIAEQRSDHQQLTVDSRAFGNKQDSQHSPERLKRVQSPKKTTDIYVGSSKATGKSIEPSTTTDLKTHFTSLKHHIHLII